MRFIKACVAFTLFLIFSVPVFAQNNFGFVNNITAVPVSGVGHDYIHDLDEIVNPANGSLSIRIEAPRPEERGLNYPFYAFMYDSTQQFALQFYQQTTGSSYSCGQDSAGDGPTGDPPQPLNCVQLVDFFYQSISWPAGINGVLSGPNSMLSSSVEYSRLYLPASYMTCNLAQGYSYEDPYGVVHDLGAYQQTGGNNNPGCSYLGIQDNPIGGDEKYKIALPDAYTNLSVGHMIDTHGNAVPQVQGSGPMPSLTLEDTNGNAMNGTGRTGTYQSFQPWGDALASPKTASRTFPGGKTYNYVWGSATTQFSPAYVDLTKNQIGYDNLCVAPKLGASGSTSNPVVVKMQQPDGLYYTFSYDPTYGLLNKITYPTGAWVQYTWGVNSLSDVTGYTTPGQGVNNYNDPVQVPAGTTMNTSCMFEHDTPAVTKRVVSYDGVHPALEQDFSYPPTAWQSGNTGVWLSKQTVVTTTDLLSPGTPSFKTVYNYSPFVPFKDIGSHLVSSQIPIESTIVYYDTAGNVLRTVTKNWNSLKSNNQLVGACTTIPNGMTSGTFYQYEGYPLAGNNGLANPAGLTTDLRTDVAEYDYGLVTTPCQRPTTTPTRETVTTYASFANTPLWPTFTAQNGNQNQQISMPPMVDRPGTVITYQNGTRIAETDYSYDQTTAATVSTPFGHDETNYGSGSTFARGNLATVTRKCFQGSTTCLDSTTTIAYDTTGQPVSVTDPDKNQTTLSYADNYTSDDGSPSGNTNTYVTKITRPPTNSVAHVQSFQWDFNKGQLRTLTDENNTQTSYQYADPWWRLTSASFPDGGSVTKTYQDAGPNPSATTKTVINSSTTLTSTTVMDGFGHVTQTQVSDPAGPRFTATTYDGLGRPYQVYNPTRCNPPTSGCGESTWGYTTYLYDPLGRTTEITRPDGASTVLMTYTNRATQVQDEGNGTQRVTRITQTDALGRITSVCEVGSGPFVGTNGTQTSSLIGSGGSPSACGLDISGTGFLTSYLYNGLDNLTQVNQNGLGQRNFVYDSLSRLTSATNPESGTTTYSYDPLGNLHTKNDARGITTCFGTWSGSSCNNSTGYDALNRLLNITYSDGTPGTTNTYDVSGGGVSSTYSVGRLVESTTSDGLTATINSYDPLGRVNNQWQCTPYNCGAAYFSLPYSYDLAGNITSAGNGPGVTIGYGPFNTANQLTAVTSNLSDANHPSTLLTNPTYTPFASIASAHLGNGADESFTYNARLWLQSSSVGYPAGGSATAGTGTLQVSGSEQSKVQTPAVAATGFATASSQGEQSAQTSGTKSTGSFSFNLYFPSSYSSNTITLYVNGTALASQNYSAPMSGYTLAQDLSSQINGNSSALVTSSVSGNSGSSGPGTLNLTSKAASSSANYSLSFSCSSCNSYVSDSGAMTGGTSTYTYDAGSVWITINGVKTSATYGQSSSTSGLASALVTGINNNTSLPTTASLSGTTINLKAKTAGASSNSITLSASASTNYPSYFSHPSFTMSASGGNLTGGAATVYTYDTGTVSVTINGNSTATYTYGQNDNAYTIASYLAGALTSDPYVNASANSCTSSSNPCTITLTSKTTGYATDYPVSASSNSANGFSPSSFNASGSNLTGGGDNVLYSLNLASFAPNGDILAANDTVNGNWVYNYDPFNRVVGSNQNSGQAIYTYVYDIAGNRWQQNGPHMMTLSFTGNNTTNNNRADGLLYDASGNLLSDGIYCYAYDAENRITQVSLPTCPNGSIVASYVYDANGRRVRKTVSGASVDFLYDLGGREIAEINSSGAPNRVEVYAGSRHLATYSYANNTTYFNHSDWLGTERLRTNVSGGIYETCSSVAFGDGLTCSGSDPSTMHFTGKERDSESGLDNFGFRYYGSSMGQFMSPDDGTDQHPDKPQSWNLYTYGRNNPLVFTDPTGHSTQTAANGDVLAVYDDNDLGVYRHGDIDNRKDWDGSKLDDTDPQTSNVGQTERWGEFANWDSKHPAGISGSAAPGAFIHFGQSIDGTIKSLNALSDKQGLSQTAIDSTHGGSMDIKTGSMADHGVYTGYLLNGNYVSIRSAGNFLAGLNAMTGTFAGNHISPLFAQKLFGAYQAGGKPGLAYTLTTGRAYPGTSAPYWGEESYSGYMQQKGISAGSQR
jgi:RHS repeat-associated protein